MLRSGGATVASRSGAGPASAAGQAQDRVRYGTIRALGTRLIPSGVDVDEPHHPAPARPQPPRGPAAPAPPCPRPIGKGSRGPAPSAPGHGSNVDASSPFRAGG